MKRMGELYVRDYMVQQVETVHENTRLIDAIGTMDRMKLSALPVVDSDDRIIGILTNTDLVAITHEIQSDIDSLTWVSESTRQFLLEQLIELGEVSRVRHLMTAPVETVGPSDNLVMAAMKLTNRSFHHLPVVDDSGCAVGVISTSDFVRAIADVGALSAG